MAGDCVRFVEESEVNPLLIFRLTQMVLSSHICIHIYVYLYIYIIYRYRYRYVYIEMDTDIDIDS